MRPLTETLTSTYKWLSLLKASQLKSIAQATGIQSSGPKLALALRLQREFQQCEYLPPEFAVSRRSSSGDQDGMNGRTGTEEDRGKDLRILSIDMGIQNLAFAHLVAPGPSRGPSSARPVPTLKAWHRLAVSAFPTEAVTSSSSLPSSIFTLANPAPKQAKPRRSSSPKQRSKAAIVTSEEEETLAGTATEENGKLSFSPDLYAAHAYTFITSLIAAYDPTHILIERQRFRSGGGSAVQEWTLRVGVFEGMLYAVLHTLARERGRSVFVQGVEPSRVARYWHGDSGDGVRGDGAETSEMKSGRKKKKMNSKEGKKAKIDLVGRWLSGWKESQHATTASEPAALLEGLKVDIGPDPNIRRVVDAYLRKWPGKKNGSGSNSPLTSADKKTGSDTDPITETRIADIDIGKLDDLADCLLQGVTWLDWHVMRGKIMRDGVNAAALKSDVSNSTSADKS